MVQYFITRSKILLFQHIFLAFPRLFLLDFDPPAGGEKSSFTKIYFYHKFS